MKYKRIFCKMNLQLHILTVSLIVLTCCTCIAVAESEYKIEYVNIQPSGRAVLGQNLTLTCKVSPNNSVIWWAFNGRNATKDPKISVGTDAVSQYFIRTLNLKDNGNYTCHAVLPENREIHSERVYVLNATLDGKVVKTEDTRVELGKDAVLRCVMKGHPLVNVGWQVERAGLSELLSKNWDVKKNTTHTETKLSFYKVGKYDNGTYSCGAIGPNGDFKSFVHLFVLQKPQVSIDTVKAVGSHILYVNWTVNDGNDPIKLFNVLTKKSGEETWVFNREEIGAGNTSYLVTDLLQDTMYGVSLKAKNSMGWSDTSEYPEMVSTLSHDPSFVPEVEVKGTTINSLSLGWTEPPADVKDFIQYYQIILKNNETKEETEQPASSLNAYMFMHLKPATTYQIQICACSDYTKSCGNWSKEVNGTTLDGMSDPPENVTLECRFDNISHSSFVSVSWQPPRNPKGVIVNYNVKLFGVASFKNNKGVLETVTYGPRVRKVPAAHTTAHFVPVPPNTNYTVNVSVETRLRHMGKEEVRHCVVSPTVPDKEKLMRVNWEKVYWENERWLFRLNMNRVSERNGPICCYIVYMVKLRPGERAADLPQPEELPVSSYEDVHRQVTGGVYLAEAVDSESWSSEIFLGDGKSSNELTPQSPCQHCMAVQHQKRLLKQTASTTTTTTTTTTPSDIPLAQIPGLYLPSSAPTDDIETTSEEYVDVSTTPILLPLLAGDSNFLQTSDMTERFKRLSEESGPTGTLPIVFDGFLDHHYNYTGFLEVLVHGENGSIISAYTNYFVPMVPGPAVLFPSGQSMQLTIAIHVLIGLLIIVIILLIVLFVLHSYTKTVAEEQGIEMSFTNTLMHLCRSVGGRHVPVSSSPPDMPPITKEELPAAVAERHRDSDYGFQHEFELLPDRFPDRTTRGSEARENFYKNRYPDIKSYDQTRVKLSQLDGIVGSDYINANYVIGYKERKKFICAQGPMDNTVNDFWRMVWEQHLQMVLMLTNLEEYRKTKCAKYWPDKEAGEKKFGDFSVTHVQEKRFSDYIIRDLKLQQCLAEGANEKDKEEERMIVQYHYLVWKDFMAPENPSGILKFIKRINEDYSLEKGPILIHCSAGVGRTGTLVALDSLLQQLREENQVAIFNTVCDLRHQRNFLVQSLKQYIFIYRALLEVSQSGDTEIKVANLKSHVEKLRHKENGKDKSRLEEEFEKLQQLVDEKGKTWSFGIIDENKAKNRNEEVIPYDRNRVMLAPIPGKDHSTYINASFIEGYDNTESFIVAQDPLPNTLSDFWRMICEQCVSTLVMLSDLGEGSRKCIRYWPEPDDESTYDNIKVKYIQSESCPYYTRREFAVTNMKTDDTIITTQFQYNGWPTVEGEVPEVTRGLVELVDVAQESHTLAVAEGSPGPTLVHCNWGAERSSIFVALSILIQQLRTERAVDIFTVARKLRSQRQMMLSQLVQYEFLHRAVVNYADLHHMVENGKTSSPL